MLNFLSETFILTLKAPRRGLRRILDLPRPKGVEIVVLALVGVLSALAFYLSVLLFAPVSLALLEQIGLRPFTMACLQFAVMLMGAGMMAKIGAWRGGQGTFEECAVALAWLQTILLVFQLGQILLLLLVPPVAVLLGYVAFGLFFAFLVQFTAEVHGFRSIISVFMGVILSLFLMLMLVSFILALFIDPEVLNNGL